MSDPVGGTEADILIIGGGIAGASAAYEIAAFASVVVLERESHCGYHATGRSAASFTENYGSDIVRRLAKASRDFLEQPPAGFAETVLLKPRGMITIAREDQVDALALDLDRARRNGTAVERMEPAAAVARVPILRRDYVAAAMIEPRSREVDVDALHQGFLSAARRRSARVFVDTEVLAIEHQGDCWAVTTRSGVVRAAVLINAAGAWADVIATLAGVVPLGLQARRRTAFTLPVPDGIDMTGWPLVNDVGDAFYFKRDAGQLFVSPSDATPSPPMDAYPEEIDVAIGVERLERATTLTVRRIARSWAGLRTFAPDESPVVGWDAAVGGFFWLAGQGGTGVKTAPALSRACAALIRHDRLPDDLLKLGLKAADLSPRRFSGPDPSLERPTP